MNEVFFSCREADEMKLTNLKIHGFKSIHHLDNLALGPVNVLIGANGSGKSNFIFFFKMLNQMAHSFGELQTFIGKYGGANSLLYEGAGVTSQIEASLSFETESGIIDYYSRLIHAAPDTLVFADEQFRFSGAFETPWLLLGSGHRETRLSAPEAGIQGTEYESSLLVQDIHLLKLMRGCLVYQFHNTSETSRIRQKWNISDSRFLKEDGANLASFLYRLRESEYGYYRRIVETIRMVAPFFDDFVLEPEHHSVMLQWKERNSDIIFGPHLVSDGTLRAMAIISLLLQPEANLPPVIILDEPELGLHPYAINIVTGLLKSVSTFAQVIIATQSTTVIDCFDPDEIIVVDRPGRESVFTRLDPEKLKDWLDEYSMAELWEKNVIGGKPR